MSIVFVSCAKHQTETKHEFKFEREKSTYIYDKKENNKTNYLEKEDSLNLIKA